MFLLIFKALQAFSLFPLALIGLLYVLGMEWNPASAQSFSPSDKIRFEHLGAAQGLTKNVILSICQDKEGFMWFGAIDGLYKFDGHSATLLRHDPNHPKNTLSSNLVNQVFEDQRGRLWLATLGGGLNQVDKRTGKVKVYLSDSTKADAWDIIESILEDRQGSLWLGTAKGIARFDPATQSFTRYPSPHEKTVHHLNEDAKGNIWGTNHLDGIYGFNPRIGRFNFYPLPPSPSGRATPVSAFHLDPSGMAWVGTWGGGLFQMDTRTPGKFTAYNPNRLINPTIISMHQIGHYLWIATTDGLQRVDQQTNQVITYRADPLQPASLSTNYVTEIFKDRMGNLWVGTVNGMNKANFRHKPFQAYQLIPTPSHLIRDENSINNILQDHTGTIWLGTGGKGLCLFDPRTHQITPVQVNFAHTRQSSNGQGWPLYEDTKNRLWVGTDLERGLYLLNRKTNQFKRYACQVSIRKLDMDSSGRLWIGANENEGIASFDPETEQFTYYNPTQEATRLLGGPVNALLVSRTGKVWMGGDGLNCLDPKTGSVVRYLPNYPSPEGHLNDRWVRSLYEDEEGILWLGTVQGGLNRFDPQTKVFTYMSGNEGLPNSWISIITGDEKGNLWIGSSQGLSRFTPKTNTCRNFDESDGLPDNQLISAYSRHGKLFFGTRNGFVIFYPDSIKDNTVVPPVYLTGLKVFEKNRPLPADKIDLSYDENFLSFDFVALNYDSPEKTRYAYQLVNLDPDWVQAGKQRTARYTDLAPGRYTFRVKASIDNNLWNEKGATLQIIIHPPLWRTAWAYGFYGVCLFAAVFAVDRYQRGRLVAREREKARERELEQAREIEKAYHQLGQKSQELLQHKEELESTLEHLKSTQEQLIEQEKATLENKHKLERAAYENKLTELEMQALRAQMNPHFIFNCLNSINRFILKNESEAASDYLTKFSKLIRLILQNSQSQAVPLENELEALRLYMEMEILRFEGQFEYTITTHPDLETEELEVPPLIIQPYVENAIWHGLMHKKGKGHIQIHLGQQRGLLVCTIEDDGIGRKRAEELKSKSATKKKSLGMQITSHRLELINALSEKQTTVQIVDLVDTAGESCGTRVILSIPV